MALLCSSCVPLVLLLCFPGPFVCSQALLARRYKLVGQDNGTAGEHATPVFPVIHLLHGADKDARASQCHVAVTLQLLQL